MNSRRIGAAATLALLLTTTTTAQAQTQLYGLPGAAPAGDLGAVPAIGLPALAAEDFPQVGGYQMKLDDAWVVAMPGMVARTHLHLLARQRGESGTLPGTSIDVARPLGAIHNAHELAMLRSVMARDAQRVASSSERPRLDTALGEQDLFDVFQRRLESISGARGAAAHRARQLGLEVSFAGLTRRRSLLVYRAQHQVQSDGRYWLVADFYDPHVQLSGDSGHRLSRLRFRLDEEGLRVQVAAAWADAVGAPGNGDRVGDWVGLEPQQLAFLDDPGSSSWRIVRWWNGTQDPSYDGADDFQALVRSGSRATPEAWLAGEVEDGTFDERWGTEALD